MNTYHFLNNPTASRDIKSLIKRLEEAIASSFERQVKSNIENENSAIIQGDKNYEECCCILPCIY